VAQRLFGSALAAAAIDRIAAALTTYLREEQMIICPGSPICSMRSTTCSASASSAPGTSSTSSIAGPPRPHSRGRFRFAPAFDWRARRASRALHEPKPSKKRSAR
jgi:hypothetical protein